MSSIRATLVTYLKAQVSAVSNRVYPAKKAPDSPIVPYIVVTRVSGPHLYTHQGYTGTSRIHWQVSVFDTDSTRCEAIADTVTAAMEAWASVEATVGSMLQVGDGEDYESDTKRHQFYREFRGLCDE